MQPIAFGFGTAIVAMVGTNWGAQQYRRAREIAWTGATTVALLCGTVGLIPVDRAVKVVEAGDLIVSVGGRTGRDGIHGATFSSLELTAQSEEVSGGAVQIGNAIT